MKRCLIVGILLLGLAGCETLSGSTKEDRYKTIGGACNAATGTLNTLSALKAQGKLTANQIKIVDEAANAIHPICNSADIPSYEWALNVLNTHVWAINGVLFDATGGADT